MNMSRFVKPTYLIQKRTFKNFGHKREPEPTFTVLWHGFLTISFIGMGIEWRRVYKFIFGDESKAESLFPTQQSE